MRLALVVIALAAIGIQNAYAGGPRMDWDERYEDIPGATDCWVDGFDDGQDHPFDHEKMKNVKIWEINTIVHS